MALVAVVQVFKYSLKYSLVLTLVLVVILSVMVMMKSFGVTEWEQIRMVILSVEMLLMGFRGPGGLIW